MSSSPQIPELEALHNQLSSVLGEAIWAFSKIESLTYDYLRVLSIEPLHELMQGQAFASRCTVAERLVNRIEGRTEEKARALAAIQRARHLAKHRNRIAHNPWKIWIDFSKREFQAGIIHPAQQNEFEISPAFVKQFSAAAQQAATELEGALNALWDAR